MIKVEEIYAVTDEELQEKLNELGGRTISVERKYDDFWRVIYETP